MSARSPRTPEQWLEERERHLRAAWRTRLLWSIGLHVGLVALLMVAPAPARHALPAVVQVDLLARMPSAAAPSTKPAAPKPQVKKAPAPAEAPPPPPPPPPPEKVKVLPKEAPAVVPKPTPKPKVKKQSKPTPKPPNRPVRREKPKELEYDDALSALRGELGEDTPSPTESETDAGETADASSGSASGVDSVLARWQGLARNHVSARWVDPPEFRNRGLETELRITLLSDGSMLGPPVVVRSSGDAFADDNAVRALLQAAPLPAPPRADDYTFIFRPEDTP